MSNDSLLKEIRETISAFPIVFHRSVLFRAGTYTRATVDAVTAILGDHGFALRRRFTPTHMAEQRIEEGDGYYYVDRCPEPEYATSCAHWYPDFVMHITERDD